MHQEFLWLAHFDAKLFPPIGVLTLTAERGQMLSWLTQLESEQLHLQGQKTLKKKSTAVLCRIRIGRWIAYGTGSARQ